MQRKMTDDMFILIFYPYFLFKGVIKISKVLIFFLIFFLFFLKSKVGAQLDVSLAIEVGMTMT